MTQHGTLGQVTPAIREERYPFAPGATLVMCSDGLKIRLPLDDYPRSAPRARRSTVAAALWRDHARGRDDATVVVVREAVP